MADNVAYTQGVGTSIATDDVGGVQYQRVKISHGADGSATDTSSTAPLPVLLGTTAPDSSLNTVGDGIAFSTTSLLTNGQTYTSSVINLTGYTQVQTSILSDVAGTVTVDFCRDAAAVDILRTVTVPYAAGDGFQMFSAPAFTPYVRYKFLCQDTGQSDFYFDTKLLTKALSPQVLGLDSFISPKMVAVVNRSIMVGKTDGGESYQNVGIDQQGNLKTAISQPLTAFGEVLTAQAYPVVQIDFVYGLNTLTTKSTTTGSGSATSSNGLCIASTSAATSSSAVIYSARNLKYRAGEGALARFTAIFSTGAANSTQYAGVGFPSLTDGIFFGYEGTAFGITLIKSGSKTTIAQTAWNIDTMSGAGGATNPSGQQLNVAKGSVYQIKFQYLGFGALYFYVESAATGELVLVHIIQYANSNTTPSLTNPSMPILWAAVNTTNNTDITVKGGSAFGAVEGLRELLGPRFGESSTDTTVTTQIASFSLKNCTTFNGVVNGALIRLRTITFGSNTGGAGNGVTYLRMIKNATLGGSPSWTPVNGSTADSGVTITSGNSVTSVDKSGTTVTNGSQEYSAIVAVGNSMSADITDLNIFVAPSEVLTFAIESTQSATVGVGVTWSEDL